MLSTGPTPFSFYNSKYTRFVIRLSATNLVVSGCGICVVSYAWSPVPDFLQRYITLFVLPLPAAAGHRVIAGSGLLGFRIYRMEKLTNHTLTTQAMIICIQLIESTNIKLGCI